MCEKNQYPTYKEAIKAIVSLKRRQKNRHQYRPYKCPQGPHFHIATITKNLRTPKKMNKYPLKNQLLSLAFPQKKKKNKK